MRRMREPQRSSEQDLTELCRKYGLPPMEYSRKLRPGDGTFDRKTGKIQLSESLRSASEVEVLRVAFHEAGHYHTCSFLREVLPLRLAGGFVMLLALCLAFASVRAWVPAYIPFFGLVAAVLVFEGGRRRGEQEADRWARAHWPDDLSARGLTPYL